MTLQTTSLMTQVQLSDYMNVPRSTLYDFWKRNNISTEHGMTYWLIGYTVTNFKYIR